jgi:hypothetical protein
MAPRTKAAPCLIISPRVTDQRLPLLLPVPDALTGTRPKAGRQTAEQFQNSGFQRRATMPSLHQQQPHHHQRGIHTVMVADTGLLIRLLHEAGRQELWKKRENPGDQGFIDVRRETECSSCLQLG